jgi:tetratricopeptide (TPR) repeat protein
MRRHALVWIAITGWLPFAGAQPPPCTALAPVSLERAACHARLRQWKDAEEVYRAYGRAHPESVPAALGRTAVLLEMARDHIEYGVEASQELRKLVEAHPDDAAVLKAQALLLGNVEKNPGAAEATLTRLTRIVPRDAGAWAQLGLFYLDSHRIDDGVRCLERAADLAPSEPLYRAGLARAYAVAGRDAEAEKLFAAALRAAGPGSNPDVFVWYGDYLESAGRYDESVKAYARAIAADPSDRAAWLKRAGVELKLDRFRNAESDALAALERGAGEREVQTLLVRAYQGLGDGEKARTAAAAVERAAAAEEDRRAKWRRARASLEEAERLMQANRFSDALPLYVQVMTEVPAYADAWFAAGVCYTQTGDARRAEQSLRTFLRLQPLSAEGHSALGVLLLSDRRAAEARTEFQEALRLDPASAEAREALETLDGRVK